METQEIAEFKIGNTIGRRYEILDHIGFGAMGLVLKVADQALENDQLAVKILYPHLMADETLFARFMNEVLVARRLTHPNIVRTHDIGRDERGYYYISMEYVNGRNLEKLIYDEHNPLAFNEVVRILCEIAKGVAFAHDEGIVHRDLKPQNVMITADGKVKVADFGLAEALWMKKNLTKTGESVGTPSYMAPEQIQGEQADHRADIYAFGIMAYEMVVRKRPFDDENWFKMAALHIMQPLPQFVTEESNIPAWYEGLVHRCAAKQPADRPQSMHEVVQQLEAALHGHTGQPLDFQPQVTVSPQQIEAAVDRATSRRAWAFGASMVAVLILLGWFVYILLPVSVKRSVAFSLDTRFHINGSSEVENLFRAAAEGDIVTVSLFVANGAELNQRNQAGETPLLLAAKSGARDLVKLLLDNRANPNLADTRNVSPLMYAVRGQDLELVQSLLGKGAAIGERDLDNNSVVSHALNSGRGSAEVLRLLLSAAGVDRRELSRADAAGLTPLISAVQEGNIQLVELLAQQREAALETPDRAEGLTPLMWAVRSGNRTAVDYLLKAGANPATRGADKRTALDLVGGIATEERGAIERLLREGAGRGSNTPYINAPSGSTSQGSFGPSRRGLISKLRISQPDVTHSPDGKTYVEYKITNENNVAVDALSVETKIGNLTKSLNGPSSLEAGRSAFYRTKLSNKVTKSQLSTPVIKSAQ